MCISLFSLEWRKPDERHETAALQAELAQQRAAAFAEDKRIWRGEEAAHRKVAAAEVRTLTQRLAQTQHGLHQTTKDYILGQALRSCHDLLQHLRVPGMKAVHRCICLS